MGTLLDRLLQHLDGQKVDVRRDSDNTASFGIEVEPAPWRVHVFANDDTQRILVHSVFPSLVPDERRAEMMEFVTRANFGLAIGNFELDLSSGELRYKTSLDANHTTLDDDVVKPLFVANISTMNRYLPGLYAVLVGQDAKSALADLSTA